MNKRNDDDRTNRTFKQGVVGGVLGAFVGAPGLGAGLGILNANKDKIKEFGQDVDASMTRRDGTGPHGKGFGHGKGEQSCKKRARDDPARFF
jgi:hypothetical protein